MTRRLSRMLRTRVACALTAALVGALVAAIGAGAGANPVSPAGDEVLKVTHPLLKWTLPAGEGTVTASIATAPEAAPSGEFAQQNLVELAALQSDDTEWSPQKPLVVGKYWWHVATRNPSEPVGVFNFSPVSTFIITPTVKIDSISFQMFGTSRQFIAKVSWYTNVTSVALTERLYKLKGTRPLLTRKVTVGNGLIDQPGQDLSPLTIPSTVKSKTRLRFVVTVKAQSATATATRTLRVP